MNLLKSIKRFVVLLYHVGEVQICHVLIYKNRHVQGEIVTIKEYEWIDKEEFKNINPVYILMQYHVPWKRQKYSMYDLYTAFIVEDFWERIDE